MKKIICIILALVITTFACAFAAGTTIDIDNVLKEHTDVSLGVTRERETVTYDLGQGTTVPGIFCYYGDDGIIFEHYDGTYWTTFGSIINVNIDNAKNAMKELNTITPVYYTYTFVNMDTLDFSLYSALIDSDVTNNIYNNFDTFINSID